MAQGGDAAERAASWAPPVRGAVVSDPPDTATAPADARSATPPTASGRTGKYDAFISYSHHDEAELRFARALEQGLEQLAKRWGRWRARDVFLDQHDLGADPKLERKLRAAIDDSKYFIFLASPASASPDSWCSKEIQHWFDARGPGAAEHLLFVITGGELCFTQSGDDVIDWERSTAAPAVLRGRLEAEPFYIDLSAARDQVDRLDIRHNPSFREAVTKLAAPLHGCSPQELDSEDLRQYKRGRRLRRLAVGALAVLTVAAIAAAVVARDRQVEADGQSRRSASRALANEALANASSERDLALLQALESVRMADTTDAWGSLLGVLGQPSRFEQRSTGVHEAAVTAIQMSDDGTLAATGDADGAVVVWDVATDTPVGPATARSFSPLRGLTAAVQEIAIFERDGETVIEGVAADGSSVVWDAATGAPVTDGVAPDALTATAIADDGALVAGAVDTDDDGVADRVRLYRDGRVEAETLVDDVPVEHLRFRPDAKAIAWSQGSTVRLWDLAGPAMPVADDFATAVTSLGFSPDGAMLAVGEVEGNIWLVDLAQSGEEPGQVEPTPTSAAVAVAFSPDGSAGDGYTLASAHQNGQVQVWSVIETFGFADDTLLGHKEEATALAFGATGQIVSGSYDGQVLWWSDTPFVGLGEVLPTEGDRPESDVTDVAFLDEQTIVSLDDHGHVLLTDLASGSGTTVPEVDDAGISHLDASAEVLVFSGTDGSIEVVEHPSADDSSSFTLSGEHADAVFLLDLADDGTGLVSVADTTVVWDLTNRTVRSRPELPDDVLVGSALYGQDGKVWIGGQDVGAGEAVVFEIDAASGAVVGEPIVAGQEGVSALALSPDGHTLATGSIDRTIRLWDTTSHHALKNNELVGHREEVSGLAFTRDGRSLISIDRDLLVNYWDVADRRLVTTLHGPTDGINDLALSADEASLVVASEDDAVYLWPLDRQEWIERACQLVGRNLTTEEWRLYGSGSPRRLCEEYDGPGPPVDWSGRLDG